VLSAFGFSEYEINLSTRPEKFVGEDAIWDTAEAALKEALDAKGWTYSVDEGGELYQAGSGGGAGYCGVRGGVFGYGGVKGGEEGAVRQGMVG
jgi:hypothetical protein